MAAEPVRYEIPDGLRLLSVSRRVLERVRTLALVGLLDGDPVYRERCWRELQAAAAFPDWNPRHFLNAEMTHAFALGLDWLFDQWTAEQRDEIRRAIVQHGLVPGRNCYRGEAPYGWWVTARHNWNQVCNAGLTIGALSVAEEESDLADEIVRGALQSIGGAMEEFAPDGGYREGPGYWAYGVSYNVYLIAVLESALGTDFQLCDYPGFDRTVRFPVQLTGPTGYSFNFADASYSRPRPTDPIFWLAQRFAVPQATRFAVRNARPHAMDVLWYRPPGDSLNALPTAASWRGVEAATLRSAWDDEQATYVAFKAGSPGVNHGQADVGSLVIEAEGIRWAVDLGPDNYNLPGYFDRRAGRWQYYRNRAEAHNTLLVNPGEGPDQVTDSQSTIIRFEPGAERSFGVMDLTAAYRPHVARLWRGIALLKGREIVVQDELQTGEAPADLWWSLVTRAQIQLQEGGRSAQLRQDGQTFQAHILSPPEGRFRVRPAEPLPGSPNPGARRRTATFAC